MTERPERGKRTERLVIPLRVEEIKRMESAAYEQDKPLATWARETLMREIDRVERAGMRSQAHRIRHDIVRAKPEARQAIDAALEEMTTRFNALPATKPEEPKS